MLVAWSISFTALAAEAIPVLAGYRVRARMDRTLRILFGYVIASFVTDIGLFVVAFSGFHNNLWLIRSFMPLEFAALMYVFAQWFPNPLMRNTILWSIPVFVLLVVLNALRASDPAGYDAADKALSAVALVVVSSGLLIRLRTSDSADLANDPRLWFGLAVLLHFGVAAVVYGANALLSSLPPEMAVVPWGVKSVAHTASSLLYAAGFRCLKIR